MEWWNKMVVPAKGAWGRVAQCLRIKKRTGIVKLRHDVKTSEYEDVRILWELLKKTNTPLDSSAAGGKKKRFSGVVEWARRAPMLCHHGV